MFLASVPIIVSDYQMFGVWSDIDLMSPVIVGIVQMGAAAPLL